jgi:hypothetical protein
LNEHEPERGCTNVLRPLSNPRKNWWNFIAIWPWVTSGCILNLRLQVMCPALQLKALEYLPLSGYVHGSHPHLLYRITHNLTHPFCLLAYAGLFTCLARRPIVSPMSERFERCLFYGIPLFQMACFAVYFSSMFLRIGWGEVVHLGSK